MCAGAAGGQGAVMGSLHAAKRRPEVTFEPSIGAEELDLFSGDPQHIFSIQTQPVGVGCWDHTHTELICRME